MVRWCVVVCWGIVILGTLDWGAARILANSATTGANSAAVQQPNKNLAITDLNQVDEDFPFQGEYTGTVLVHRGGWYWQNVGLQVVALGGGKFDAVEFPCGLPGAGWYGGEKTLLHGERVGSGAESAVRLSGGPRLLAIQNGLATVTDTEGRVLGYLRKTERVSPTMGALPPYSALVLFDGTTTEHFKNAKMTDDNLLTVGTELNRPFRDYRLHLEFRLPYMPYARGQGRANSGVYLQSRYEVQILDSFGLEGIDNECGALYKYRPPDLNMCLPPLSWQTYDIDFTSPRFDENGKKICNARLTVWHNGVVIHNNFEIERKTGAGAAEEPKLLPTKLQNHGNPVHFRNVWLIDRSGCDPYAPAQVAGPSSSVQPAPPPQIVRPNKRRPLRVLLVPFDQRSLAW